MEQYVITISRQFGSMGRSIARELSEILGIEFLTEILWRLRRSAWAFRYLSSAMKKRV